MEDNFSVEIPEGVQGKILSWMPPKSLMRFMCVSKNWASMIREKKFEESYLVQSKTRPRVLFAFRQKLLDPNREILFHSVYQDEELLLSSGQQHMRLSDRPVNTISAPIRGLICLQKESKVVIYNPGTRKFRTLPEIRDAKFSGSFLGYDEVTKVYKVLCIALISGEKQAVIMRLGEESWRPIVCKHDHSVITNGVWKGEVLYYGAWSISGESMVMSFNVRSEELTAIDFPEGVNFPLHAKLVNYNGNIALVKNSVVTKEVIKIRVRNEISGEWSKKGTEIPSWREIFEGIKFSFEGIIGTGELVFTQLGLLDDGSFFVVYYNEDTKEFKKFKIDGGVGSSYHFARTFLNHVDSLSLP